VVSAGAAGWFGADGVPAVEARALSVTYRGGARGVLALDLVAPAGEVFGFLGPNGAGKTTTIRTMMDLLRPTSGEVRVLGLDSRHDSMAVRRRVGYLPGDLVLPPRLTGREVLDWLGRLRGDGRWPRRAELVDRLGVDLHRPVRELSRGNRQKLGLVQAFQHDPDLVVLDEPTSGLDPLVQDEFQQLLREQVRAGRSVFLSSHSLDEVQRVADRVAIIREGRLAVVESVESLRERGLRRVVLTFAGPVGAETAARFERLGAVTELEVRGDVLRFAVGGSFDEVVKLAAQFEVVDLQSRAADLDEVFLSLYRGDAAGGASPGSPPSAGERA
jgi:ABC-2 type transport system ATP-binding protein